MNAGPRNGQIRTMPRARPSSEARAARATAASPGRTSSTPPAPFAPFAGAPAAGLSTADSIALLTREPARLDAHPLGETPAERVLAAVHVDHHRPPEGLDLGHSQPRPGRMPRSAR